MLIVTKIMEGGVDLESGNPLPRCIAIGNGKDEVYLPVRDEDLKSLLRLYAESGNGNLPPKQVVAQAVSNQRKVMAKALDDYAAGTEGPSDYAEPAAPAFFSDDGMEPGEDYSDSGTGVRSL